MASTELTASEMMDNVAAHILAAKEERGLSYGQLADVTGIAGNTLMQYVRGRCLPSTYVLYQLSRALGVTMDELVTVRIKG